MLFNCLTNLFLLAIRAFNSSGFEGQVVSVLFKLFWPSTHLFTWVIPNLYNNPIITGIRRLAIILTCVCINLPKLTGVLTPPLFIDFTSELLNVPIFDISWALDFSFVSK